MVIGHMSQSFKLRLELNAHPTVTSQAWISFTTEHLLLASQVFVLLIEEVTMEKNPKGTSISTEFYGVQKYSKKVSTHKVLVDLRTHELLGAVTLLPLPQPLCNPY